MNIITIIYRYHNTLGQQQVPLHVVAFLKLRFSQCSFNKIIPYIYYICNTIRLVKLLT